MHQSIDFHGILGTSMSRRPAIPSKMISQRNKSTNEATFTSIFARYSPSQVISASTCGDLVPIIGYQEDQPLVNSVNSPLTRPRPLTCSRPIAILLLNKCLNLSQMPIRRNFVQNANRIRGSLHLRVIVRLSARSESGTQK